MYRTAISSRAREPSFEPRGDGRQLRGNLRELRYHVAPDGLGKDDAVPEVIKAAPDAPQESHLLRLLFEARSCQHNQFLQRVFRHRLMLEGKFSDEDGQGDDHPAQKPEQPPLNLRDILFEDFDLPLDVLCSISVATRPRNSASSRRWLLLWLPVRRTVERVRPFSMAGWAAGKRREELPDWKLGLPS